MPSEKEDNSIFNLNFIINNDLCLYLQRMSAELKLLKKNTIETFVAHCQDSKELSTKLNEKSDRS